MKDRTTVVVDHISVFWKTYAGVAAVVAFGLGFHFFLNALQSSKDTSDWRMAEAFIAESSVTEHSQHSGTSMRTYLVAKLIIEYEADGERFNNPVFRRWHRKVPTDYASELAAGQTIAIRYDPQEPTIVSLAPAVPD